MHVVMQGISRLVALIFAQEVNLTAEIAARETPQLDTINASARWRVVQEARNLRHLRGHNENLTNCERVAHDAKAPRTVDQQELEELLNVAAARAEAR